MILRVLAAAIVSLECTRVVEPDDPSLPEGFGILQLESPTPMGPKNGRLITNTAIVTLWWKAVKSATHDVAEVSTNSLFRTVDFLGTTDTTYILTGSLAEHSYFWRVRAGHFSTVGPWSEIWRFVRGKGILLD